MKHENVVIDSGVLEHIKQSYRSMNTERLANIIVSPRVSEKATTRADFENQHVFSVLKSATKPEIKKAVELMFDVKVKSVSYEYARKAHTHRTNFWQEERLEEGLCKLT